MINRFNPKKLHLSKWTAVSPERKERHFIVSELIKNEDDEIIACNLEAVINKNVYEMDWAELKNKEIWLMGWN
ncbi:MAG: TIGR02450 family Trp-rich protein [Cocleimonas sp.]